MIASLIILAAIGISGSCFIIGTLLRDDAAEDVSHDFADDPRPSSLLVSPPFFHDHGANR
jgi:hypothetical protein